MFVVVLCCTGVETAYAEQENSGSLSVQNGQFAFTESDFDNALAGGSDVSVEYLGAKDGNSYYSITYEQYDTELTIALEKNGETIEAIDVVFDNETTTRALAYIISKRIADTMDSTIEKEETEDYMKDLITNGEHQGEAVSVSEKILDSGGIHRIKPIPNASSSIPSTNHASKTAIAPADIFEGNGDSVISLNNRSDAWVLYVKGNSEERHFSVKGYDASGNSTELFVNTTDSYEGITIDPSQSTTLLEIKATGSWTIEQRSSFTLDSISEGQTYYGNGDNVILVKSYGTSAYIQGNDAGRHFSVKSYGSKSSKLLVNTTDPYNGTVLLKGDPYLLVIKAKDNWTITF